MNFEELLDLAISIHAPDKRCDCYEVVASSDLFRSAQTAFR
jgi:hypothetical protein